MKKRTYRLIGFDILTAALLFTVGAYVVGLPLGLVWIPLTLAWAGAGFLAAGTP